MQISSSYLRRICRAFLAAISILLLADSKVPAQRQQATTRSYDNSQVGDRDPDHIVVPTNQVLTPLGQQAVIGGRPTDLALSPDHRTLAVLGGSEVVLLDTSTAKVISRAEHSQGSYKGITFNRDGSRLFASSKGGQIGVFHVSGARILERQQSITPPVRAKSDYKTALPIGLKLSPDGKRLWVVLNLNNTLAEIDLRTGKTLREIPVGNAPYDVVLTGGKAYVSNWAGRRPRAGDVTGPSGIAEPVVVDQQRNIAADGSVSVVDLASGKQVAEIQVGLHPCGMALSPAARYVCVANANSDTVSVIDVHASRVVQSVPIRDSNAPDLFGSGPNAVAFSGDGSTLYVSNGSENSIAVLSFEPPHCAWLGCLPTAWYPAGIVCDPAKNMLYVANVKGYGTRNTSWRGRRKVKEKVIFGYNSSDNQGTISLIPIPQAKDLPTHSRRVLENNRHAEKLAALAKPNVRAAPAPIPKRAGEPSVFKHVLYIIKENRTFDQVFGDMPQAEADPSLCIFGREVTPNHHKLVEEFVLLDNFYCSGAISADGHQWTDEAYVTDYIEKGFGGFVRSYPFDGGDAMAYASSGFLWDNALAHGKTLRVYGEFVQATIRWKDRMRKQRPTFIDCLRDFEKGTNAIEILATAKIKTLEPYICPTAVGFPSIVPDLHRAAQFISELKQFEREDRLPNLMIMLLPNDHTSGTVAGQPTPESSVADNDLALGRIVEAVTRSKFWKDTCIVVVQDDPQDGFDHIDGHRTVAMVISPYSRLRKVDSTNYNQTSMVRTIELILGLPPMNQFDASATPMASCFGDKTDLAPYTALKNNIPLDRLNPEPAKIRSAQQRHWAEVSQTLPLDEVDEADEDTLNRILWFSARGRDDTYPAWAVNHAEPDDDD